MCPAPSLWETSFRRAQQGRRGFWSRSWSTNFCSSNSSTFTWLSTTPTDPWRGCSLTSRLFERGGGVFKSQILCPILVSFFPFFKIISDTVSYTGEPRIFEEKCWWLSDSGSHDWCRTAVPSISDCPGSCTQQRLKSRPQLGKVTTKCQSLVN